MRLVLRKVTLEDADNIVEWRNIPSIREHCLDKSEVTIESNNKFYSENIVTSKYIQFIVDKIEEEFGLSTYSIGTVYIKNINNEECQIGFFPSSDKEWNSESACMALELMVEKTIHEYGIKKVFAIVLPEYEDEIELYTKVGFKVQTTSDRSTDVVYMLYEA